MRKACQAPSLESAVKTEEGRSDQLLTRAWRPKLVRESWSVHLLIKMVDSLISAHANIANICDTDTVRDRRTSPCPPKRVPNAGPTECARRKIPR